MISMEMLKFTIGIFAIAGSFFSLVKYMSYLLEQQKKYFEAHLVNHKEKIKSCESNVKANNDLIHQTREDIAGLKSSFNTTFKTIEDDIKDVKSETGKAFGFLTSIARDVNQLIGSHNTKIKKGDAGE